MRSRNCWSPADDENDRGLLSACMVFQRTNAETLSEVCRDVSRVLFSLAAVWRRFCVLCPCLSCCIFCVGDKCTLQLLVVEDIYEYMVYGYQIVDRRLFGLLTGDATHGDTELARRKVFV